MRLIPYDPAVSGTSTTRAQVWTGASARGTAAAQWRSRALDDINHLASVKADWNGYGGDPLAPAARDAMWSILTQLDSLQVVGSAPAVALTVDGGISCRWSEGGFVVVLEATPVGDVEVYFSSDTGEEHELPAAEASLLTKWVWQASLVV